VVVLLSLEVSMAQTLRVDPVPAGLRPLGISSVVSGDVITGLYFAAANSGENSVSIFRGPTSGGFYHPELATIIQGVTAPYGISDVGRLDGRAIVTSPSTNSIYVVKIPEGTILGVVPVGPQPYSAGCTQIANQTVAVVSNYGDSSVSLVDLGTLTVIGRVANVPGSRGWRGVGTFSSPNPNGTARYLALVVGSDAGVVTLVDLSTLAIAAQIPMGQPTSVKAGLVDPGSNISGVFIASAGYGTIYSLDNTTLQISPFAQNVGLPKISSLTAWSV